MAHKLEIKFLHAGLPCMVVATSMGHRCGYVGVPKEHVFFNVDYNECINKSHNHDDDCHPYCGDTAETRLTAHGGITFTGFWDRDKKFWYIGFDCGHHGDGQDKSIMDPILAKVAGSINKEGPVRSRDYVMKECISLAEQLASMLTGV